jgi:ribosome biogenesis protein ERB1
VLIGSILIYLLSLIKLSSKSLDIISKPFFLAFFSLERHHKSAVRQVNFHKKYPLFETASDDGNVVICHGMVYK